MIRQSSRLRTIAAHAAAPSAQKGMADLLRDLGWHEDQDYRRNMRGAQAFVSPRGAQLSVSLEGDQWELGESTDGDMVPGSRYRKVDEGEGADSLNDAIQSRTAFLIVEEPDEEPEEDEAEAEERREAQADWEATWEEGLHPEWRCPPRE